MTAKFKIFELATHGKTESICESEYQYVLVDPKIKELQKEFDTPSKAKSELEKHREVFMEYVILPYIRC